LHNLDPAYSGARQISVPVHILITIVKLRFHMGPTQ